MTSGLICFWYQRLSGRGAGDLLYSLAGARVVLTGQNPYTIPNPPGGLPIFYPLTAFILVIPFLPLPPEVAAAIFFGGSSAALAFLLSREGWHRLLFFLAAPYWQSLQVVQWSPLLCAVWLSPILLMLVSAKPNIGLAVMLSTRWERIGLVTLAGIILLSLLIQPLWPLSWLEVIRKHPNAMPLLSAPGVVLLLAAVRWRERRARLLLALSLIPQRLFYDQLPLFLIPQTTRTLQIMVIGSWITYIGWFFWPQGGMSWAIIGEFIPALLIILLAPQSDRIGTPRRSMVE